MYMDVSENSSEPETCLNYILLHTAAFHDNIFPSGLVEAHSTDKKATNGAAVKSLPWMK